MLDSARCRLANPATGRQPITPIIETVRGLLVGTPVGPGGWLALAWCAGLLVASYLTASALFRRRAAR
jgi:ABC-2 type transport system permease protein